MNKNIYAKITVEADPLEAEVIASDIENSMVEEAGWQVIRRKVFRQTTTTTATVVTEFVLEVDE